MGEVYRADDLRLGRPVALKFLPPSLQADPESRARLLNEARAASMLRSPNIAVTYDIGESDGRDFIVMEFVEGELLSSRVAKGAAPDPRSDRDRHSDRRRAGRGAHPRDHSSRHQEREPDPHRARSGEGPRLRPGKIRRRPGRRRRDAPADDDGRHRGRYGFVHGARTGARQDGRRARRPVFPRRRALRAADRPCTVCRHDADRDHRPHPARGRAAGVAIRQRRADIARCDRRPRAREGAGIPLPVGARYLQRPESGRRRARRRSSPHVAHRRRGPAARRKLGRGDDLRQHHP